MQNLELHSVVYAERSSTCIPESRGKVLCKKAGRKQRSTTVCLWQVIFYLKLQCIQTAKSGRLCSLKAELVQHMHKNPRLLFSALTGPQTHWISLHLPFSDSRFSSLYHLCRRILPDMHVKHVRFNTVFWCLTLGCCNLNMDLLKLSFAIICFLLLSFEFFFFTVFSTCFKQKVIACSSYVSQNTFLMLCLLNKSWEKDLHWWVCRFCAWFRFPLKEELNKG